MSKQKERTKRPRQKVLASMEPIFDQALTDAVLNYVDARDRRMELTKEETETQEALQKLMKEKKLSRYVTPEGLVAVFVHSEAEKVRVSRPKESGSNGEAS